MKSAVETLNPTRVKLTVEVPYEELKPSVDKALKTIASSLNLPGFRPGKVPLRLVEQRVGRAAVLQEAINEALPDFYNQAVAENELRPLGQPEVDLLQVPAEVGDLMEFTAEVDVRPEITLPAYDSLTVTVDAIDDSAIEDAAQERMTTLRQRFGTLVGVERPAQDGDFVSIDLTATIDDEEIDTVTGISYEIGSGNMLEGMDEALVGLSAGESTTFTAPLAGGDRAGEDASVTVTVGSVKERELPELDDDFAQLASEFDSLEELQADIRGHAVKSKAFEQGVQARDKLMDLLLETVEVPVPDSVIEHEVHHHLEGEGRLEDAEHRAEVEESTRSGLKSQLLLDTIAEKEGVEVSQQDLIEYLVMTAQQYNMDPNEFAQAVDKNNQIGAMAGEVARRKALAVVLEHATVTDTNGAPVDLNALIETEGVDALSDEFDDEDGVLEVTEFEETIEVVDLGDVEDDAVAADADTADDVDDVEDDAVAADADAKDTEKA